jgi:solute carrier family 25 phosphate transporter 3
MIGEQHHDQDVEAEKVPTEADRQCWTTFVSTALVAAGLIVGYVVLTWQAPQQGGGIRTHSFEYFVFCAIGGILSGLPHTILTPVDHIKCRVQVGDFASATEGYHAIGEECGGKGFAAKVGLYCRGWAPTFVGYSAQGAMKFGLYEFFKYKYALFVGIETALEHRVVLFLAASATAEVFADVALAPWEAIKVKMQTTKCYPPVLAIVASRTWALEGLNGFYKGLVALWCRQVPYTMVKFAAFEKIIEFIYTVVVAPTPKAALSASTQLFISLVSGFTAGVLCALVSHPADTLVSKMNQLADSRATVLSVARDLGCAGLWKGLPVRLMMIGTITAMQWLIYDSFKVAVGLATTGSAPASSPLIMKGS